MSKERFEELSAECKRATRLMAKHYKIYYELVEPGKEDTEEARDSLYLTLLLSAKLGVVIKEMTDLHPDNTKGA